MRELAKDTGHTPMETMADTIEQIVVAEKHLPPNLDWPSARLYHYLDLPVELYTPLFVVSRVVGWSAHIIEQLEHNRLIRPLANYTVRRGEVGCRPINDDRYDERRTENRSGISRARIAASEGIARASSRRNSRIALRTADVGAWTERYPWPALGTAAVAGVTTGWGMGRMLWRSRKPTQAAAAAEPTSAGSQAAPSSRATSATASLVGGLGTLVSTVASAVAVAAAEAVKDVVKEKVHETLNPTPDDDSSGESPSTAATGDA